MSRTNCVWHKYHDLLMIGLHEPNTFLFLIINSQPVQFRRNESELYKIESGNTKNKNTILAKQKTKAVKPARTKIEFIIRD